MIDQSISLGYNTTNVGDFMITFESRHPFRLSFISMYITKKLFMLIVDSVWVPNKQCLYSLA